MRRLIVMRHAKSDWSSGAPDDHSRPLNHRGRRDAPRVAQRLCELGWIPEHVFSSDSLRTKETYSGMCDILEGAADHDLGSTFCESLYHAGPDAVHSALQQAAENIQTAMVLGHNPGWERVVEWLAEESIRMTTANAALLSIKANDWPSALEQAGAWTLENVIRPRDL